MTEAAANIEAFDYLKDIEERSLESASISTREDDLSRFWTGIGFRLAGHDYIVRLSEVAEIISIPRYTKVPGAKKWVKGLANIRGTLLPIMDLHGFLGRKTPSSLRRQRLLVLNHNDIHCGVIVDEVLGLNHYENEQWVQDIPVEDELVADFTKGGFYSDEKLWTVFSLKALAETPEFRQVALL
jgi:twitching motility protein PilI